MNRKLFSIFLLFLPLLAFSQGIEFSHGSWDELLTQSKESGKPLLVDCYTDWCRPCKWMSANTFPDPKVGALFNENFVCAKINMEKGEGVDIAKEYGIRAYPTLLVVNGEGEVLTVKVGALDVEKMLDFGKYAINEENHIPVFTKKWESGNRDPEFVRDYILMLHSSNLPISEPIEHYKTSGEMDGAKLLEEGNWELFNEIFWKLDSPHFTWFRDNHSKFVAKYGDRAESKLFYAYSQNLNWANHGDTPEEDFEFILETIEGSKFNRKKELKSYCEMRWAEIHKDWDAYAPAAIAYMETEPASAGNWNFLNALAWTFFEQVEDEKMLDEALGWAKKSISLEENYYNTDTYAMLLWKAGDTKAAIKTAERAIVLAKEGGFDSKPTEEALEEMRKD